MTLKYYTVEPGERLREHVKNFFVIESDNLLKLNKVDILTFAPDGCANIYFVLEDLFQVYEGGLKKIEKGSAYVVGQTTGIVRYELGREAFLLGVSIQPWSVGRMLGSPAELFTDRIEAGEAVCGDEFEKTASAVMKSARENPRKAFGAIGEYLAGKIGRCDAAGVVKDVVSLIDSSKGVVEISALAGKSGISLRRLEMIFKREVGISPKKLASIFRIKYLREYLLNNNFTKLAQLANNFGFTDQAYFTNEFKKVMKISPNKYLKMIRQGAVCREVADEGGGGRKRTVVVTSVLKNHVKFD